MNQDAHTERRACARMLLDCAAECTDQQTAFSARVVNLCGQGLGLRLDRSLAPGQELEVFVQSDGPLVPKLRARVQVRHVQARPDGFLVGARILESLD